MLLRLLPVAVALLFVCENASAQTTTPDSLAKKANPAAPAVHSSSKWYDKLNLKGYAQFRYNRLLESNPDYKCEQCDKGIGKNQGFEFRRARLVISGDVHERVFVYLQFDYSADASSTSKHFLQVRDAYTDIAFDAKKEYRVRIGQSKVPYSMDVLQSSSIRIPFDRSDALNSGAPNERDFGAYFMYAPAKIRERFKHLASDALKGTGDYGVFAVGLYNGQSANKPELNNNLHAVARLTYPFALGKQIIEPSIQAYTGKYTLDQLSKGVKVRSDLTYTDRRAAVSLALYPQPFGIMAEYNIGQSPSFDAGTDSIRVQKLSGGYVTASYRGKLGKGFLMPYVRYQKYDGAKKLELDARHYHLNELEFGLEWQPIKNLELTLAYVVGDRRYTNYQTNYNEKGNFLRVQVQTNY